MYVKRDDVLKIRHGVIDMYPDERENVLNFINAIPAADVAPVVYGEWISNDLGGYKYAFVCSKCGWVDGFPFNDRHNYCPNCGANMSGGKIS